MYKLWCISCVNSGYLATLAVLALASHVSNYHRKVVRLTKTDRHDNEWQSKKLGVNLGSLEWWKDALGTKAAIRNTRSDGCVWRGADGRAVAVVDCHKASRSSSEVRHRWDGHFPNARLAKRLSHPSADLLTSTYSSKIVVIWTDNVDDVFAL